MSYQNFTYVNARNATINNAGRDQINYIGVFPKPPGPSNPNGPNSSSMSDDDSYPSSWMPRTPDSSSRINVLDHVSRSRAGAERLQQPHLPASPSVLNLPAPMNRTYILHMMDVSVDHELAAFKANVSPWQDSVKWVVADSEHVNSVVQQIAQLTKRVEIHQAGFTDKLIVYPRLIVYIFSHLMLCEGDHTLLDNLKEALQEWKTWDTITVIQNHLQIKDYLHKLFQNLLADPHFHPKIMFEDILTYDIIGLAARLRNIVMDNKRHKFLLARRNTNAQFLLDLLQARLDFYTDPALKLCIVHLLIKLSRASGLYPRSLVLEGVTRNDYPIARGGYGEVHRGEFQGREVAVKVLKIYRNSDMGALLKTFSCEAVTWRQLDHPNILPFYGVSCEPTVSLVSPWSDNGNLVEFLAKQAQGPNCVLLSLDVAEGLEYLHNQGIIHGDMKGLNILMSPSYRACLADFGLAIAIDTNPALTNAMSSNDGTAGTLRWQAPELLLSMENREHKQRKTKATDVYAFALVCYEMFSGQFPFPDISQDWLVVPAVKEGRRPLRPAHALSRTRGLTDDIWHLIKTCWSHDPSERLGASQIVNHLRGLPNRPVDTRMLDNFTSPSVLLSMHNSAEHPFGALNIHPEDTDAMRHLKHISSA
ncbi:hypothetical protein PILCRDRAFT_287169 [Piloderma croceum F 1598]|uniref:Protein kinase domain-containing protein n=1 Tax=Piloderma croceum (strain F 1598) TaxID=765440 RepID=A0A0C3CD84_PILCF|nr:hypothetical protein PILCRDRAFT_287169 [Piloderma croceum F 1598]